MAKRVGSECDTLSPQTKVKKNCGSFKLEWPSEYVQIEAQAEKLGENFSFLSEKGLLYKTCSGANVVSEFSHGKIWTKWTHSAEKSFECCWDYTKTHYTKNPEQVKVLIDNILLAIKMSASMLSVQQIHDHMTKYMSIPESSINENETMCKVKNAPWHTLIVDESTGITVQKMLVIYT